MINERIHDGVNNNPNSVITDMAKMKTKYQILKVGLKHGLLIRLRKSEMTVITENVYHQILK